MAYLRFYPIHIWMPRTGHLNRGLTTHVSMVLKQNLENFHFQYSVKVMVHGHQQERDVKVKLYAEFYSCFYFLKAVSECITLP